MRERNADMVVSGVLTLCGIAMAAGSVRYGLFGQGGRIGPGFMPFVAGLALAAFSAWACVEIAVRARRSAPQQGSASAVEGAETAPPEDSGKQKGAGRKLVLVFALTVGAAALTPVTGFLVAFGLLIFVLLAFVEREPLWLAAVITVTAVVAAWLLFVRLLAVPLPGGLLNLLGAGG